MSICVVLFITVSCYIYPPTYIIVVIRVKLLLFSIFPKFIISSELYFVSNCLVLVVSVAINTLAAKIQSCFTHNTDTENKW